MPRPQKERMVHQPPLFSEFKPIGVYGKMLSETKMTIDEYEAIRLADYEGLDHLQASEEMEISRSSFTRLIESARKKTAETIVKGNKLIIEGGSVHFKRNILKCAKCGYMFEMRMEKQFSSCPDCGAEDVVNIAGRYGHGKCCRDFKHNRRQNNA